jgi:hypothetical protein
MVYNRAGDLHQVEGWIEEVINQVAYGVSVTSHTQALVNVQVVEPDSCQM